MPNAPSIVGAGFNPVAFGDGLPAGARAEVEALLDRLGAHPVVPEDTLEAYAILAAMGPTYFWFQWQALRELASSFGLPARRRRRGAARDARRGGAYVLRLRGAAQVIDLVPVKPLAEAEPQIRQAYNDKLGGLYRKLSGA